MTNQFIYKPLVSAILLLLSMGVGIVLSRLGRPYGPGIFTVHKLSSLALIIVLIKSLIAFSKSMGMEGMALVTVLVCGLALLLLLVSGGFMSVDKIHGTMHWIHRISGGLLLLCVVFFVLKFTSG